MAELEASDAGGDWDVLLVGALGCVNPSGRYGLNRINAFIGGGGRAARRVSPRVTVPRRPFGTHAYVLSKRGAAKLLRRASLATYHIDAVCWGIGDLRLFCCAPMLAHQAFQGPSTIGAVLGGLEVALPNVVLDAYTGATLPWAFNEPVVRVPGLGTVLTIGRSLGLGALGFALVLGLHLLAALRGATLGLESPAALAVAANRFLALHASAVVAMFALLRCMLVPRPAEGAEARIAAALQAGEQHRAVAAAFAAAAPQGAEAAVAEATDDAPAAPPLAEGEELVA